jgi:two-component system sensor histidine kinase PilS (NtrC family)
MFEKHVRNLIFGRLAIHCLLFIGGMWWVYTYTTFSMTSIPRGLPVLFIVSLGLAAAYLVWLRARRGILWQVRTQFLIDALLITWLVWGTGDLTSPYITLYIILIGVAGFFLGKHWVHLIAATCGLCFTVLSLLSAQSLIYSLSGDVETSRAVQIVLFNVAAILLVGLVAGRIADRRQITEKLQKTEEDFADLNVLHELILSSIKSGIITTDLQGKIRAINRSAEELSGLSADDAIGRSVFSIFGDDLRAPIESSLNSVQNAEFAPPRFEASIERNGVGAKTVACSVSPLIGRAGGVNGLILAFQDRTEFHEMEENLRRADRLSAVGRMAAGLAHEIRNPLGSISSAVQFLADKGSETAERGALMNVIVRESDRLNNIISDFLAYARPQDGISHRRISDVDAGEALKDCLALLKHDPSVREKHVFDLREPSKKILIQADETQLKQVFWNILQNSVQAMPDGGTLAIDLDEPDDNFVRIAFSDDGCGIDRATLENIYEPFQSGSNGTGLGLSIVHRIVTEGGGRIDVSSERGVGTKITIELPKKYEQALDR